MRAIVLVLLALAGCGQAEKKESEVSKLTADQIAAQRLLSEIETKEAARAQQKRREGVLEKLDTLDKLKRFEAASKQLLKDMAAGKITDEQLGELQREMEEKVLAGKF